MSKQIHKTSISVKNRRDLNGHYERFSDSSLYDGVCIYCGARDYTLGENEINKYRCTATEIEKGIIDKRYFNK